MFGRSNGPDLFCEGNPGPIEPGYDAEVEIYRQASRAVSVFGLELDTKKAFNKWYKRAVKAGRLEKINKERLARCYELFYKYKYEETEINDTVNAAVIDILNKETD